jgi:hypothetical protein
MYDISGEEIFLAIAIQSAMIPVLHFIALNCINAVSKYYSLDLYEVNGYE